MNTTNYFIKAYDVGDLIKVSGWMALIVAKQRYPMIPEIMYKLHFCGEEQSDNRWLFAGDIELAYEK